MTQSITKAAADKLGDRLRKSEEISEEDLRLLQDFRRDYDEPLIHVERVLREDLHLDPTSRIKTPNTILEKLRREKTRLSSMQDIAGVRIVREMTLDQQDAMVASICNRFPQNRVDDRRSKPSYGYRAVHVIVTVSDLPVEQGLRSSEQLSNRLKLSPLPRAGEPIWRPSSRAALLLFTGAEGVLLGTVKEFWSRFGNAEQQRSSRRKWKSPRVS